jgi:hypothetical protein
MNESEYYAGEFNDANLNAQADFGEFYLDESGFFLMPTQKEIRELVQMGNNLESLTSRATIVSLRKSDAN